MTENRVEQSNPFSTGGGGTNFEVSVQTYFASCMLMGWKIPGLKDDKIAKIKLQGRYDGYDTDDCIVYGANDHKLLCQIKHSIAITKTNLVFKDVIESAWNDFCNTDLFNINKDRIALVVSGLNATDIKDTRMIFEWACACENEKEFLKKLYLTKFASKGKQNKYEVIKYHLENISNKSISDEQVWIFLRSFFILILDLDIPRSSVNTDIDSGLERFSGEKNFSAKVYRYVANMNQNAGTILLETLLEELDSKKALVSATIANDYEKLKSHNDLISSNIRNNVAGITINRIDEVQELQQSLVNNDVVLITGERGSGKSGIVKEFKEKISEDKYCLMFRAEELYEPHFQNVLNKIGIESSIEELEQSLILYEDKYLFIESLEKLLEHDNTKAFSDLLLMVSRQKGWKIIASIRSYAVQQVVMNFISTYFLNCEIMNVQNFSKNQIEDFIDNIKLFQNISFNTELLDLIRNPFYLECIYKTLCSGYVIKTNDTKKSIKNTIWDTVVNKNSERANGLPQKRNKCFIEIALKRAKTMKYAIDEDEFNEEALFKLEEDGLIKREDGLVCLSHDVFEDWAIERFIEKKYNEHRGEGFNKFFESIGAEQSICRAYRLWLYEKFESDIFIQNYIENFFKEKDIRRIWFDETLSAVIYSEKLNSLLFTLRTLLYEEDFKLLKRICFIIRISAKRPDMSFVNSLKIEENAKKASLVSLKPYGRCWKQLIEFLYNVRDCLSKDMYIHCMYILDDWSKNIKINCDMPEASKEAGLLALFIIDNIKDDYSSRKLIKPLFSVAMMTFSTISKEFTEFINESIFNEDKRIYRNYIDDLAKQAYSDLCCAFISKNDPELVIRIAKREWLLDQQPDNKKTEMARMYEYDTDGDSKYGLNGNGVHDYFPASGAREPFRSLFQFAPKNAIDFVVELCNISAKSYINLQLSRYENKEEVQDSITCELKKSNGDIIKHYCLGEFWGAYRGASNVPYLLQSALMALENWLLMHFETFKDNKEEIDYCIDYLLSSSNSVFITAVVASAVMPYYKNIGESILLLLQNNNFYSADISRMIHERGDNEINWFSMNSDPLKKLYIEDRRLAATREWRRESLEELCVKLQFTSLRDKVLDILDEMNDKYCGNDEWRFRIHRLDTRRFNMEYDENQGGIVCTSGEIQDEDLIEISKNTSEKNQKISRFMNIMVWADDAIKKKVEFNIYKNPEDVYNEIQMLLTLSQKLSENERNGLYNRGIIQSVCVLYRDFQEDLSEENFMWCRDFIIQKFKEYDESLEYITGNGRIDNTGMWTVAEIIPLLSKYISDKQSLELLIMGLTSCDMDVRIHTAKGISMYLWNVDEVLADKCLVISSYFDVQDLKKREEYSKIYHQKQKNTREKYKKWLLKIRRKLNTTRNLSKLEVVEDEISLFGVTMRMLMLCAQYNERHNIYVSETISRMAIAEKQSNDHSIKENRRIERYYESLEHNTYKLAEYLYGINIEDLNYFKSVLEQACQDAPRFMRGVLVYYDYLCEQLGDKSKYWELWGIISSTMEDIAKKLCKGQNYKYDEKREILNKFIYLNTPWQEVDYKSQPIKEGVDLICEFVRKTAENPIVFEGIVSLMYHFPELILEKGILALDELNEASVLKCLEESDNSIFYLENVMHSYVINMESKTMHVKIFNICEKLLDGLVRVASSKSYYVREYLIKSKRIV